MDLFVGGVALIQLETFGVEVCPIDPVVGSEPERKAVPGSLAPAGTKYPHELLYMTFPGGGTSLCFKNLIFHI